MAQINYVAAASIIDPNSSFTSLGDPYNYDSLRWHTTQVNEYDLEAAWIGIEKKRIIKKLTDDMVVDLQLNFQSDILVPGVMRRYDTDLQSQIGIIGAFIYSQKDSGHPDGRSFKVSSYDLNTGLISFDNYTVDQISALVDTFASFTEGLIQRLTDKINQVLAVNDANPHVSLDLIYAITWS
jgi:hypothetical protein